MERKCCKLATATFLLISTAYVHQVNIFLYHDSNFNALKILFSYIYFNIVLMHEEKTFILEIRFIAFISLVKNFRISQKKKTFCYLEFRRLLISYPKFNSLLTHIMSADVCIIYEQIQLA